MNQITNPNEKMYTVKEVAVMIGCQQDTLDDKEYEYEKRGLFTIRKIKNQDLVKFNQEEEYSVYIAHDKVKNIYKIGKSINPIKRVRSLKCSNLDIELISYRRGYSILEKDMHKNYKDYCIGGEWFNFTEEKLREILKKYSMSIIK